VRERVRRALLQHCTRMASGMADLLPKSAVLRYRSDESLPASRCRCLMQLAMDPPLAIAVGQEPFVHHLIAQVQCTD